MIRVVPFIAGLIEFVLCGFMFLMAAFGVAGYAVFSWNPRYQSVVSSISADLGFLAVVAFAFSLAGAISAIKMWSVTLSVVGASFVTCWGLLESWFSLSFPLDVGDIATGVIFGTFAIFFSMIVMILVVATKECFKPNALRRAAIE